MLIPYDQISAEALLNLATSVVLREGTDYGEYEVSFEQKVQALIDKVKKGEAVIMFSEAQEEVDIIAKETFEQRLHGE
ncbi:MAG: YheU family protein [Aestuariibacter sp.]